MAGMFESADKMNELIEMATVAAGSNPPPRCAGRCSQGLPPPCGRGHLPYR